MMSEKPVKPDDSECCGSGCKPCIFDVYEEQLKKWESKNENFIQSEALNQIKYLPFLVENVEDFGEVLKIFHFQAVVLKKENLNISHIEKAELGKDYEVLKDYLNIKSGEYLIMKGVYGTETVSRSYTPVLSKESFAKGCFTIIISLQANGKMSHFLKRLQSNSIVFWRGPYCEFTKDLRSYKHLFLFGGGTGAVPLYNIAKNIVEDEESDIWVNVFASFKTIDSIVLRREFRRLKDFWNFKMNIYITNQNQSDFQPFFNESIIFGRIGEAAIVEEFRKCGQDKFFVIICGPERFNRFLESCFKNLGLEDENIFIFWYLAILVLNPSKFFLNHDISLELGVIDKIIVIVAACMAYYTPLTPIIISSMSFTICDSTSTCILHRRLRCQGQSQCSLFKSCVKPPLF